VLRLLGQGRAPFPADRLPDNSASKSEMEQLVHELAKVLKKSVPLPTIYKTQLSSLLKLKKTG
jgi:hypothetical protein